VLPDEREAFGFKMEPVSRPSRERASGFESPRAAAQAREFVLGYPDEMGETLVPQPEAGGAMELHRVSQAPSAWAAFRRYLKDNAPSPEAEELLAAR
jgi:hypothetical protein